MVDPDALPTTKPGPARPWIVLAGLEGHDLGAILGALGTLGLSSVDAPGLRAISKGALEALGQRWWDATPGRSGIEVGSLAKLLDRRLEAFIAPTRKAFLHATESLSDTGSPTTPGFVLADPSLSCLLPLLERAAGPPAAAVLVLGDPLAEREGPGAVPRVRPDPCPGDLGTPATLGPRQPQASPGIGHQSPGRPGRARPLGPHRQELPRAPRHRLCR